MLRTLSRIDMVSRHPDFLAGFYEAAFGFKRSGWSVDLPKGSIELSLGKQKIALLDIQPYGRRYPVDVMGWSPLFQHIAIVTSDMANAYARLSNIPDWEPISTSGPQGLPQASGGATAFKFRDPEGHPLELIAFAPGAVPAQWRANSSKGCLGIDHSAISIANTPKSVAFYECFGLSRDGGSLNLGEEQAKLDGVENAVVEVTTLMPGQSTPHVELLCYRGNFDRHVPAHMTNDVAATRLMFAVDHDAFDRIFSRYAESIVEGTVASERTARRALLRDPDGHLIGIETTA